MQIQKEHFLDASEPDEQGFYDYYYEGDIYRVSVAGEHYKCRSYVDTPEQISFLNHNDTLFASIPYDAPSFVQCIRYFYKELGFRSFLVLAGKNEDGPYSPIDLGRVDLA